MCGESNVMALFPCLSFLVKLEQIVDINERLFSQG